jgi:hypothetical protein
MAADDPILDETVPTRAVAVKLAKAMGCEGAHEMDDGWHPCESHEALLALINGGVKGYRAYMARTHGKRVRVNFLQEKTLVKSYTKQRRIIKLGNRTTISNTSNL